MRCQSGAPPPPFSYPLKFNRKSTENRRNFLFPLGCQEKSADFFTGYLHVYTKNWYKAGTWWYRYRLQVSSRFPRFSSAHKNLVRQVQALLRPVLESPAHRLYDGIPCCLVSSSLLVKYFIIKKMKITIHFVWQRSRAGRAQGIRTFQYFFFL